MPERRFLMRASDTISGNIIGHCSMADVLSQMPDTIL